MWALWRICEMSLVATSFYFPDKLRCALTGQKSQGCVQQTIKDSLSCTVCGIYILSMCLSRLSLVQVQKLTYSNFV